MALIHRSTTRLHIFERFYAIIGNRHDAPRAHQLPSQERLIDMVVLGQKDMNRRGWIDRPRTGRGFEKVVWLLAHHLRALWRR